VWIRRGHSGGSESSTPLFHGRADFPARLNVVSFPIHSQTGGFQHSVKPRFILRGLWHD
jgi:hypothetical protein